MSSCPTHPKYIIWVKYSKGGILTDSAFLLLNNQHKSVCMLCTPQINQMGVFNYFIIILFDTYFFLLNYLKINSILQDSFKNDLLLGSTYLEPREYKNFSVKIFFFRITILFFIFYRSLLKFFGS